MEECKGNVGTTLQKKDRGDLPLALRRTKRRNEQRITTKIKL